MHKMLCVVVTGSFLFFVCLNGAAEKYPMPPAEAIMEIENKAKNDKNGNTPLLLAIRQGDIDLINYFATRYPDQVNTPNRNGRDPYLQAINFMNAEAARILLDAGFNFGSENVKESLWFLINFIAQAEKGSKEHKIVPLLQILQMGLNSTKLPPSVLNGALEYAYAQNSYDAAKLLVRAGAQLGNLYPAKQDFIYMP